MTILSIVLLSFFIFGLYLSNKVRITDRNNKLYKLCSFSILAASSLVFLEYEISKVKDVETIFSYGNTHSFISTFSVYICILTVWNFMNPSSHKKASLLEKFLLLIYSLSTFTILYGVSFTEKGLFKDISFENGLWVYQFRTELDWLMASHLSFATLSLVAINFSFWRYCKKDKIASAKGRSYLLMVLILTMSSSIFVFLIFNGEIQQSGYFLMSPPLMICCAGLGWTFTSYKLFELSPISAMDNIVDSVSNLIIISDNNSNVKYMNRIAREAMGIRGSDIPELTAQKLAKICNYDNTYQMIDRVNNLKIGEKFQTNFSIKSDNTESFYSMTFSPIFNPQNKRMGNVSIGTNITATKEAELKLQNKNKELEASNVELERFAYIASHDLKTPLRNVVSFLSLIERKIKKYDDKELVEFIQIANNSASQMYHLIQDVLEYSQINNYDKKKLEVVDLNEIVLKTSQILQPIIEGKKCSIFTDQLPIVMGDSIRLSQLFQNIVENGLKYNENSDPTVHISYQKNKEFHIFYIKDNGIGIKEDYQTRIFEMFKRLHTYNEYEGTGIGLAVCKKIVSSYQGDISLSSKEGSGSTFKISLKLEEIKTRPEAHSDASTANLD